jgi:hypothetical protein
VVAVTVAEVACGLSLEMSLEAIFGEEAVTAAATATASKLSKIDKASPNSLSLPKKF